MTLPGLVAANNLADVVDRERAWDNIGANIEVQWDLNNLYDYIGYPMGGGYFAGYISHTADGNPTHALIVASRVPSGGKAGASGVGYNAGFTRNYSWALTGPAAGSSVITGVTEEQLLIDYNARRDFDGAVNVAVMKANSYSFASYEAAKYIDDLNAGEGFSGQTDWYLPSRLELDIAYFNLKPETLQNATGVGANPYSVPKRDNNYTLTVPAQTLLTAFNTNVEAFVPSSHWSSTEGFAPETRGFVFSFGNGSQGSNAVKTGGAPIRAFRKIAL